MAYEANRDSFLSDDEVVPERESDSDNTIKGAEDADNASGVPFDSVLPHAMVAGAAVAGMHKLSDGKSDNQLTERLNRSNNDQVPIDREILNMFEELDDSAVKSSFSEMGNNKKEGGDDSNSPPNYDAGNADLDDVGKAIDSDDSDDSDDSKDSKDSDDSDDSKDDEKDKKSSGWAKFKAVFKGIRFILFILFFPSSIFAVILAIVISTVVVLFGNFTDALGISNIVGGETGGIQVNVTDPEQKAFYERVNDVKLRYQAQGKTIEPNAVAAVYDVLSNFGVSIKYKDMTTEKIEKIADAMLNNGVYDENTFSANLVSTIIPDYASNLTTNEKQNLANEIIQYVRNYNDLVGNENTSETVETVSSTCGVSSCTFDIKGFYSKSRGNVAETTELKDLKVRLMQCNTNKPISGESLIPIEDYILGVMYSSYDSSVPAEATKAKFVAARSYILASHINSNSSYVIKVENGKYILEASTCNLTYCNPEKGCSKDGSGVVHSGTTSGTKLLDPLAYSSPLRSYSSATSGDLLTNAQGYVVYSPFDTSAISKFTKLANSGLSYKQILMQYYNQGSDKLDVTSIAKNTCTSSTAGCVSTGEFSKWRQGDSAWANIPMGDSGQTIRQIGCLVTSVSMLIVKSGVPTNIANFNPGNFVKFLNTHGGFSSGGNFNWSVATQAAPSFKYQGKIYISGKSKQYKLDAISAIANKPDFYAVCEVKGNTGQHWVAIDSVTNGKINMMDPSSNSTDMWKQYNWENTSTIAYYKVSR